MANSWANSKPITDKSWAILMQNKYLLTFPVFGAALCLVWAAIVGSACLVAFNANSVFAGWVLVVIGIFGLTFLATLASAGLVGAAEAEMRGEQGSFGQGMGRAFPRIGALLVWSVIQTIVSLLLGLIRGDGSGNVIGVILRSVAAAAAGVAWAVITLFVLPSIVITGASPVEAIKESAGLARKRWGMQIAGGVRIGARIALILILPGVVLIVLGIVAFASTGSAVGASAGFVLVAIGFVAVLIGSLLNATMKGVFSVALYHFARDNEELGGFTAAELQGAVRTK